MSETGESLPLLGFDLTGAFSVTEQIDFDSRCPDLELRVEASAERKQTRHMRVVSDKLFPTEKYPVHKRLFTITPGLIFAAFDESDLPKPYSTKTLQRVIDPSFEPDELAYSSQPEQCRGILAMSRFGHRNHAEAIDLTIRTKRYFAEVYNDPVAGNVVDCGMGYALSLLDRAWIDVALELTGQGDGEPALNADWSTVEQWLQAPEE